MKLPSLLVTTGLVAAITAVPALADHLPTISSPAPGEIVTADSVLLEATNPGELDDGELDGVQWAFRPDCASGSGAVIAGNVGGATDVAEYVADDAGDGQFSFELSTVGVEPGSYCFIFNPRDGDRATVEFFVVDEYVEVGGNVVLDGAESGNKGKPGFTHAFDGLVADAGDAGFVGSVSVNYRELKETVVYEVESYETKAATGVGAFAPDAKAEITATDGSLLQVLGAGESPDFDRGAVIVRNAGDGSTSGPYDVGNAASGNGSWVELVNGNGHVVTVD